MVENDISQLKRTVTEHDKYLETNEVHCRDFHARIQNFEIARDELDHRTKETPRSPKTSTVCKLLLISTID
jgi:hypothetical protein